MISNCKEPFVVVIKVALKVTRLYFIVLIYYFITSKTTKNASFLATLEKGKATIF